MTRQGEQSSLNTPNPLLNGPGRPMGQRVIAGLLAMSMLVTGCGGAFEEGTASGTAGSFDSDAAGLQLSQLKWTVSEPVMEQGDADQVGVTDDDADGKVVAVGKATANTCIVTHVTTVGGLSTQHKNNLAGVWTEADPTRPGQKRPRTMHSRQSEMRHAETHHHQYHRRHFHPGGQAAHYSLKFNSINHQTNTASWNVSTEVPLDSASCAQHLRKLQQIQNGTVPVPTVSDSGRDFDWTPYVVSTVVGAIIAFAGSALIAGAASPAIAPWAAVIAGCVVGGGTGAMVTYMRPEPGRHADYLAGSFQNCILGAAGGVGVRMVNGWGWAATSLRGAAARVPADGVLQTTGLERAAYAAAASRTSPGAVELHVHHALSVAADRVARLPATP